VLEGNTQRSRERGRPVSAGTTKTASSPASGVNSTTSTVRVMTRASFRAAVVRA